MNAEEKARFDEANEAWHAVEDNYAYKVLSQFGFKPIDGAQKSFVRKYRFVHTSGVMVTYSVGYNTDYWSASSDCPGGGYWSDLKPWAKKHFKEITFHYE